MILAVVLSQEAMNMKKSHGKKSHKPEKKQGHTLIPQNQHRSNRPAPELEKHEEESTQPIPPPPTPPVIVSAFVNP